MLPILPYREPKILKTDEEVVSVLKEKGITKVLLVTDKGIRGLKLTDPPPNAIRALHSLSLYIFNASATLLVVGLGIVSS